MYIKRYSVAVLIFILLAGWYIYAFVSTLSVAPAFFGIVLPSFPIAVWISILLVFVYLISLLHFSYYSMMGNFRLRKYKKDYDKLHDSLIAAFLKQENRHFSYKTDRYKFLGEIVEQSSIYFDGDISTIKHDRLASVLQLLQKIKNTEAVDLKKYNLSLKNPFVIANNFNKYKANKISAEDVLKKPEVYFDDLCKVAYSDLVKTASYELILKYKSFITKDILFTIINRINFKENSLEFSYEKLITLITSLDLKEKDYIEISKMLSLNITPEDRIKLFESLSENNEKIMLAYLFTLFDLEMLNVADEVLENSQDNEYESFKAYRALRKYNQNYSISLFI